MPCRDYSVINGFATFFFFFLRGRDSEGEREGRREGESEGGRERKKYQLIVLISCVPIDWFSYVPRPGFKLATSESSGHPQD